MIPLGHLRPAVARGAWLAPSSVVAGAVTLGPDSSVWYGAVLRAEDATITIGAGSNIQDNAVVHVDAGAPAHIGEQVSVGHGAILHGCYIGSGTIVGMGSIVLSHARIGSDSMIAAGAVVATDGQFPDRSLLVGVPARVRRTLTDDEVTENLRQVQTYAQLAATHRQGISRIRSRSARAGNRR
ncbi:gamma carbonic anhydrase family protein (plasmid) [Nocardioides sp. R1-1]|uniref:gamma carbonic anhydrase family protein n=1 Tax=Nocardioides sp. R1-1 TaxID=3383502 RepID=UPI0038CFF108